MDKTFDRDIARVAARRAVDRIVAVIKRHDGFNMAYQGLHDSERDHLLDEWMTFVQEEILAEQDRQLGVAAPHDPKAAPALRVPDALRLAIIAEAEK